MRKLGEDRRSPREVPSVHARVDLGLAADGSREAAAKKVGNGGGYDGSKTDIKMLHDSKSKMLGIMLDRKAGGASTVKGAGGGAHTTSDGKFDRSGYMTSLKTARSEIKSHNDIADIRKVRSFCLSVSPSLRLSVSLCR